MKALAALSVAVAVIGVSPVASAQTRTMMAHAETAAALKCLLDHVRNSCDHDFVGSATRPAQYWLWWNAEKDFKLGPLVSTEYVGNQSVNSYITKYLNGRPADVYDVRFEHYKKTFYIVPLDPDGKVRYLNVRDGEPNDEKLYLFAGR
jgi:hypothetical protein